MASKRTKVVDGFTAIRAAQEAARHGRGDPLRPEAEPAPPRPEAAAKAGARIGRSVIPEKREVICPACGVASLVSGKVDLWVCTHCRHRMKLVDQRLPEGDWSGELEVGGTVVIPAETRLTGGRITANDIELHGSMEGVELRACHCLRISATAKVDWVRLQFLDLELGPGLNLIPGKPLLGRHLHLHGKFIGNLRLDGTLVIHATGDFSGDLRAAGLRVEEGGGLRAQLDVNPAHAPPPPAPPRRTPAATKPAASKANPPPPPMKAPPPKPPKPKS